MPDNTVKVDRSTVWGNPWRLNEEVPYGFVPPDARSAVMLFRRMMLDPVMCKAVNYPLDFGPLKGRNLACWCRLDQPCHADVPLAHLARTTQAPIQLSVHATRSELHSDLEAASRTRSEEE